MKRSNLTPLDFSIASNRFSIDFPPQPESFVSSSLYPVRRKISAGFCIQPLFQKLFICFSPRPSISIAFFETKCLSLSIACASQTKPATHFLAASPSLRCVSFPQLGHFVGKTNFSLYRLRAFCITRTTCGITSPAR